MIATYTLVKLPLLTLSGQLRWNIDSSSSQQALKVSNGRIELRGWLLAESEPFARLAVKNSIGTYCFPFNIRRPDVISAILEQPADNHPRLLCGFDIKVPFSSQMTIGLESDGLLTWLEELTFSPA